MKEAKDMSAEEEISERASLSFFSKLQFKGLISEDIKR